MIDACDIKTGTEITCKIRDTYIPNAKLNIENNVLYICQDERNGNRCCDLMGFRYSWKVGLIPWCTYNVKTFFEMIGVSDVNLIKPPDWDAEVNI